MTPKCVLWQTLKTLMKRCIRYCIKPQESISIYRGGGGGMTVMTLPNSCFSSIKGILKQGHDLIATRSNHLDTHCAMPSWTKMPTYSVSEYLSFSYKWTHNKTLWYKFSDFDSNKTLWCKFSDFESNSLQLATRNLQLATRNLQLATRNSHFTLSPELEYSSTNSHVYADKVFITFITLTFFKGSVYFGTTTPPAEIYDCTNLQASVSFFSTCLGNFHAFLASVEFLKTSFFLKKKFFQK